MLTITALARRFGLARSTLLHYDRIGLLRPPGRSGAGYRCYGEAEVLRLERIRGYREAGLALETIQRILDAPGFQPAEALQARLLELDREIRALRGQQAVIARLLGRPELLAGTGPMDKATWVELLRASGMDEAAMDRWHADFERLSPERHQRFLEALGMGRGEVEAVRGRAAGR
jgi:MerR family transcriptional regulator, thiopeptide resistance regulator